MDKYTDEIMRITGGYDLVETNRYYPSAAVSAQGKISYFTKAKIEKLIEVYGWDKKMGYRGEWMIDSNERQKYGIMAKPGKFFKHVCPDASDREIQALVQEWYAVCQPAERDFLLETDIKINYLGRNYVSCSGSLGNSCMKHDSCQDYLDFYDNYDVKILVLKEGDKVAGRALVWENVYFPYLGKTLNFMDRIYTVNSNDDLLFKNYANKNGWVYKKYQSFTEKRSFAYNDDYFEDVIKIESTNPHYHGEYPYVDTMGYMDDDKGLCNAEKGDYYITLDHTDGTHSEDERYICEDCGNRFDPEDGGIYVEGFGDVCESCSDEYTCCDECGYWVHNDDITHIDDNYYCDQCRDNEFVQCDECGEWGPIDESHEHDWDYYCWDCFDEKFSICEECGDTFERDELTEHDGCFYCGECLEEITEDEEEAA